jgi:hypothetical protein
VTAIHWNECAWETLQPLNLMDDLAVVVSLYAFSAFSPELRAQSVQLGFDVSPPDKNPFSHPTTGAFHHFKISVSVSALPCSDSAMGGDDRCPAHRIFVIILAVLFERHALKQLGVDCEEQPTRLKCIFGVAAEGGLDFFREFLKAEVFIGFDKCELFGSLGHFHIPLLRRCSGQPGHPVIEGGAFDAAAFSDFEKLRAGAFLPSTVQGASSNVC